MSARFGSTGRLALCLLAACVCLVAFRAAALEPPHAEGNAIGCRSCHAVHGKLLLRGAEQEAMCKSCHNPTGQASSMADVANHVVGTSSTVVDCGSCHDPHAFNVTTDPHSSTSAKNLSLVRKNTAKYVSGALEPAIFQKRPDHFAFGETSAPWDGVCQSCHTKTDHHRNASGADHSHGLGGACTSCHPHEKGFLPQGGCTTCHAFQQGKRRPIVGASGDFVRPTHHVRTAVQDSDCVVCHDVAGHKSGTVRLANADDGTSYSYDPANPSTVEAFCVSCHDADGRLKGGGIKPFSDGVTVPNVKGAAGSLWADSAHRNIGYAPNGGKAVSCLGDGVTTGCHGNGHGSDNTKLIAGGAVGASMQTFCVRCHTDGKIANNALSGAGLADDIQQAFGMSSKHPLGAALKVSAGTYTLGCTTCHNPHVVTGKHSDAPLGRSPVTRANLSADSASNPRAMGTSLWGAQASQKMAAFAGSGTYRTPASDKAAGNELPDYATFCLDCHAVPQAVFGPHGGISWGTDDPHGLNSANVPNGSGSVPDWFAAGLGEGWDGDDCKSTEQTCWPVLQRSRGEQIFSRAPYYQEERIAGANFVLSCTDCHESHGSGVRSMIRSNPNGGTGTTIWNTMCNNCHYYYSDWHAGMSCASVSCHGAPPNNPRFPAGSDSIHGMSRKTGAAGTRTFNRDLVVDMRFENDLNDSGSWRLHGRFSVANGAFGAGKAGNAAVLNDTPVEVGTRNSSWSTDEGKHGTWKFTEMKYNMTLEAWVYPTVDSGERKIFAKHTYTDGGYALMLKKIDGVLRAGLLTNMTGGGPNWPGWDAADCNGLRGAFGTPEIPLNRWTHIAATYDSKGPDRNPADGSVGRVRILVNGEDATSSYADVSRCFAEPGVGETAMFPYSAHSPAHESICYNGTWCASALTIGGMNWSDTNASFVGRLDEAKVWNVTKPASYYDPKIAPSLVKAELLGNSKVLATFSEGVQKSGGGALAAGAFTLVCAGRTIAGVAHAGGGSTVTLTLSSPLSQSEIMAVIGSGTLSVVASSVYDEYANAAPAETVPLRLADSLPCTAGTTTLSFNEPAGSAYAFDDLGNLIGAVSKPAAAFTGDGSFHGDPAQGTWIAFDNNPSCLGVTSAMTLEARIRPSGIGSATYVRRILSRETSQNYQASVWRNTSWPSYQPPDGVASIAFWSAPADSHGGNAWKVALTDYAACPIVSDHWYKVRVVWSSAKPTGIPADIFVDDQGTNGSGAGELWAKYKNCTDADQSQVQTQSRLFTGDSIIAVDADFTVGAHNNDRANANNQFQGSIDWMSWKAVADYAGVDDPPM
jgi:hypothetical protein